MGLDMYLTKEIYIGGNWDHRNVQGLCYFTIEGKKMEIPVNKIESIILDMGYWRKANHIHQWFVNNVQNGNDNCQKAHVRLDELENLKDICEKVLFDRECAEELLPTQSGFFFGDASYNEYYFQDLERTIKIIDECFSSDAIYVGHYFYQSSW